MEFRTKDSIKNRLIILMLIIMFSMMGMMLYQGNQLRKLNYQTQSLKTQGISSKATFATMVQSVPMRKMVNSRPDLKAIVKDSIKTKPRKVEAIVSAKVGLKHSKLRLPVRDTVIIRDTIPFKGKSVEYIDSCLKLNAFICDTGDMSEVSFSLSIPITVVTTWERNKSILWGLIRYGKKHRETSYFSSCPGAIFTEKESLSD
jgi:hypothetical protein